MGKKQFMRILVVLFLFILLTACGGGGGGSSDDGGNTNTDGDNNGSTVTGIEIDMWAGGVASSADGVTVEVLEGSWTGTVEVVFEETETTNAPVEDGFPASDVYVIRLNGFETGKTTVPFKVTVPVTTIDLPTPIDEYAFAIETYNEDTGAWERNDAMAQYDEATNSVTFWSNHFSKKRVVYAGEDPEVELQRYVYKSEHDKFYITYFSPVIFNKPSNHLPPADTEWQGSGTAIDPEVPDYIEDLGKALETALTYHTTTIIQPNGYLLFDDPTHDVVSLPDHAISVTVKKIPAKGDTRLGGPIRIDTQLKNWHEMKVVACHELVHLLGDQYYTGQGARLNRWFYEAIAEFYGTRAAGYTNDEYTTYFSNHYSYLRVSLDASDETSYYAVGDFLYWLEDKMNGPVAAGVVTSNYPYDIGGLNNLLKEWGSSLGDEFTQYVLESTVGDHDYRAVNIKESLSLKSSLFKQLEFKQPHLSARDVNVYSNGLEDGMLVAESGVHYQYGGGIPLKTYSYTDAIPVADIDNNLEKSTEVNKPVVVKHFGKKGTVGVEHWVFHQVIINPLIVDAVIDGVYYFDYYLLVPPEKTLQVDGKITWTFPDATVYGGADSPIKGFFVYLDGVQLTDSPLDSSLREYSNIRIRSTSDVQVTVVDEYDNEWPEVEKSELQPNWEVRMSLTGTFADYTNYSPAVVSEWFQKWIPVTVSPDGTVNFDYYLESDFSGSGQIEDKPNHIWGTGTFEDDKLIINGEWATKQTIVINKGAVDQRSDVLTVDGEFTLAGHFIGDFFFSDGDESQATANATHVSTWVDPDYRDSETHTGTNMTPEMYIDDFRPK